MRHLVRAAALDDQLQLDSAGTAGYHSGELPDRRARAAGKRFGIEVSGRARQFLADDFAIFDYVLAMDQSNLEALMKLAPDPAAQKKIHLFRTFDHASPKGASVPDPYYGTDADFDEVVRQSLTAAEGLLERLRRDHRLVASGA